MFIAIAIAVIGLVGLSLYYLIRRRHGENTALKIMLPPLIIFAIAVIVLPEYVDDFAERGKRNALRKYRERAEDEIFMVFRNSLRVDPSIVSEIDQKLAVSQELKAKSDKIYNSIPGGTVIAVRPCLANCREARFAESMDAHADAESLEKQAYYLRRRIARENITQLDSNSAPVQNYRKVNQALDKIESRYPWFYIPDRFIRWLADLPSSSELSTNSQNLF